MTLAAGLDLAASPSRCSGYALLDVEGRRLASAGCSWGDDDVLAKLASASFIAIDSPLSLPSEGTWRSVDLEFMKATGFRLLPPGWRSMRALAERAILLAEALRARAAILETHPRSALLSSGCGSLEELLAASSISHAGLPDEEDARDAVVAALVALYYASGSAPCFSSRDGTICVLPRICWTRRRPPSRPPPSSTPARLGARAS